jgi:hypothetical protein
MARRTGILGLLGRTYRKLTIRVFGNTIDLRVNLLYAVYVWLVKLAGFFGLGQRPRVSEAGRREAATIHANGFTKLLSVLPEADLTSISAKVDALFAQPDKTVKTLEDGGLVRLKSCLEEVPELERYVLAPKVKEVLQGYFGCAYKVYNCDVYRTVPQAHDNPEEKFGSLKWHFDNCPDALLKIMVYLTDTNVENGALTLIDKGTSVNLKHRGFWDRNEAHRYTQEIEEGALALEAPAGTALLFSVHHCIHKATLPRVRHRDVAVFLVQPALVQQQAFTDGERRKFSHSYGYCVNPFLDTPLRYGNE